MKKLLILSFLFLVFTSCSSDSEDSNMNPPPNNNDVTYIGDVKAIIDANCLGCHSDPPVNGAPMSLVTSADVMSAITTRGLINRVENGSMPPGGQDLTAAQVQTIKDWQANGFKEQ